MPDSQTEVVRGLIPEDLLLFSWLQEVALSPSGKALAYTVRRPDAERNGYQTDAYLRNPQTGAEIKLTSGTGYASSLAWSHDGDRLAFTWRSGAHTAVRVVTAGGAPVADYPVSGAAPSEWDWSSDGRKLACSRWTPLREAEGHDTRPEVPAPTMRVVTRLRYKQDGAGWVNDRYRQIWILDLATGEFRQLTDGECDYGEPRWSWGGARLAFVAMAREQNTPLGQGQILIHDFRTGRTVPMIEGWQGASGSPQWRHDDQVIAFTGHSPAPPVNRSQFHHVWVCDLATGQARDLSAELDQEVGNYAVADQRAGLVNVTVKWPDGRGRMYFLLTEQGATHLYSASEDGECRLEVGGHCIVFEYSACADGAMAYGMSNPSSPGELYTLRDGVTEQHTDLNSWLSFRKLSPPREYWYSGIDGTPVHAWEIRPLGFQEGRRYPTILQVHCSMFCWDFNLEFQCMAAAGYVVAYFNQRGTTAGYGQAWTKAGSGAKSAWGYDEIMLGADDLVQRDCVDESRLGVTGGSCGGYLTNWIVGHTDRFAAAVTQRSISNEVSDFGTADIGPESGEVTTGGQRPWTDINAYWRMSPLSAVENIHTPLLILHADEDYRCPLGQAEELFTALRWMGREVELVVFQGESHGLTRGGRPGNRIEHLRRSLGWFHKYLGTRPA